MDEFERFVAEHGVTAAMGSIVLLVVVIEGWLTRRAVVRLWSSLPAAERSALRCGLVSPAAERSAVEECSSAEGRAVEAFDVADDSVAAPEADAPLLQGAASAVVVPPRGAASPLLAQEDGVTTVYRLPVGESDERETVVVTMDMELVQAIASGRQ
jgi:hypothetical protein